MSGDSACGSAPPVARAQDRRSPVRAAALREAGAHERLLDGCGIVADRIGVQEDLAPMPVDLDDEQAYGVTADDRDPMRVDEGIGPRQVGAHTVARGVRPAHGGPRP